MTTAFEHAGPRAWNALPESWLSNAAAHTPFVYLYTPAQTDTSTSLSADTVSAFDVTVLTEYARPRRSRISSTYRVEFPRRRSPVTPPSIFFRGPAVAFNVQFFDTITEFLMFAYFY